MDIDKKALKAKLRVWALKEILNAILIFGGFFDIAKMIQSGGSLLRIIVLILCVAGLVVVFYGAEAIVKNIDRNAEKQKAQEKQRNELLKRLVSALKSEVERWYY